MIYLNSHFLCFLNIYVAKLFLDFSYWKVCDFGLSRSKANTFLSSKTAAGTVSFLHSKLKSYILSVCILLKVSKGWFQLLRLPFDFWYSFVFLFLA